MAKSGSRMLGIAAAGFALAAILAGQWFARPPLVFGLDWPTALWLTLAAALATLSAWMLATRPARA